MSVEVEWMAIPQSKFESPMASMPKRIKAILAARSSIHIGDFLNSLLGFLALA